MAISIAEFLDALRKLHLVDPAKVDDIARQVQGKNLEPRVVAHKLIEKKLLTPYQVNQLLQGKGQLLLLGSYVLIDRLGEGGMGEVFRARHWKMDRVVAIKLIRKDRLASEMAVKRFQREARAAAALSHPNVVHAFDADQVGDTHLFVMEYVEGVDLAKLVKAKGPLPVDVACEYIRQAALGLQHAHEKGTVHRDIKPHNLLLASAGKKAATDTVKILDMGLARMARAEGEDATSTLTEEGAVMGTPDYIAPEQAMGAHDVDIRADLYSLGCTFYFLLSGQPPFPGGTLGAKLVQHQIEEPVPVEKLRPDVPRAVAAVVRKLMAKKPEKRYQTPAELAAALAGGARQAPGAAPAAGARGSGPKSAAHPPDATALQSTLAWDGTPPARHRWRYAVGTVLLLALLGGVGYRLWFSETEAGPDKSTVADTRSAGAPALAVAPFDEQQARIYQQRWADHLQCRVVETNSIGMPLTLIPPGEFTMGSPNTEPERETGKNLAREGPQHQVRISRAFYLGVTEVRQKEYEKLNVNVSAFKDPDYPAESMTWDDVVAFCNKLTELPEEKKAGRKYRLPTEAEWEYACRAGTTTVFHYGNTLRSKQANFHGEHPYGIAEKGVDLGRTTKCGQYEKNAWGLFDMHGNVWEWCLDGPRDYTKAPPRETLLDPRGPETPGGARVVRGGSWTDGGLNCRAARRVPFPPSRRYNHLGFRVVCER